MSKVNESKATLNGELRTCERLPNTNDQDQGDLVFDPMAGGGVVADTCLALNRKC
jgi:hypothetical protein